MKKTWNWAACGYNLPYQDDLEIIEICKYAAITAVEANSSFSEGKSVRELEELRKRYKAEGVRLESFHLPFSAEDDISAFYETKRKQVEEMMSRMFEAAALLGSRVVILHPSTSRYNIEGEGIDRYLSSLGKSLEGLIPKAEKLGLVIALENMLSGVKGEHLGSRPEHFKLFAEKFGHPCLGFCLDTGHAHITGGADGPAVFFDAMSKHIAAFHIHDNPGDRDVHLAPGRGFIDWGNIFSRMAKMEYRHAACIEAPPFSPADHYIYTFDAWKKMMEESDALAEKSIK